MTLLSICIPTYNRADLLEYCLENIRGLDEHKIDYEVVIIDHASTDHTQDIIKKAQEKWDNIRSFRQKHQVGLEMQFNTTLRQGSGTFTTFLADDDKHVVEKLVQYLDTIKKDDGISALYAPWIAYDDEEGKEIHGYFKVPEKQTFSKENPLAMFNFMAQQQVFPETAIFRTKDLHDVMMSHPDAPYQWFLMSYSMLRKGKVVFETEPFYLEIATTKKKFKRDSRINIDCNISHLEQFRAGVEIMLNRMFMDYGKEKIPDEMRANLHEILLNYAHNRLMVAYRRALGSGQFIQAVEFAQRIMIWRGMFDQGIVEASHGIYGAAALQSFCEVYKGASWMKQIFIYGFKKTDEVVKSITSRLPDAKIAVADAAEIAKYKHPDSVMLLVKNASDKETFANGKIPPGNILSLEALAEYYKLIPAKRSLDDL